MTLLINVMVVNKAQCTACIHHTHIEGSLGWLVENRGVGGHCSGLVTPQRAALVCC